MMRARTLVVLMLALVAVVLALGACGGGDDEETTTSPAPTESPSGSPAPPSVGELPPEFVECMADQGYEIESSADVHSAPPQVLQQCFGH
jgi:hypothetical protein